MTTYFRNIRASNDLNENLGNKKFFEYFLSLIKLYKEHEDKLIMFINNNLFFIKQERYIEFIIIAIQKLIMHSYGYLKLGVLDSLNDINFINVKLVSFLQNIVENEIIKNRILIKKFLSNKNKLNTTKEHFEKAFLYFNLNETSFIKNLKNIFEISNKDTLKIEINKNIAQFYGRLEDSIWNKFNDKTFEEKIQNEKLSSTSGVIKNVPSILKRSADSLIYSPNKILDDHRTYFFRQIVYEPIKTKIMNSGNLLLSTWTIFLFPIFLLILLLKKFR